MTFLFLAKSLERKSQQAGHGPMTERMGRSLYCWHPGQQVLSLADLNIPPPPPPPPIPTNRFGSTHTSNSCSKSQHGRRCAE